MQFSLPIMIYPADIRDNLSLTGLTRPTYNQVSR